MSLGFLDVFGPAFVIAGRIDRQPDDLDVSSLEVRFDLRHVAELRRADRRKILRVRKQNRPGIADPIVEADFAFACFSFEIRCSVANLHNFLLLAFASLKTNSFQVADRKSISCCLGGQAMSSKNFFKSILPPEMMATIGPLPALPLSAAATGRAPAPSEMMRARSAISRIAFFVSSRLTTK